MRNWLAVVAVASVFSVAARGGRSSGDRPRFVFTAVPYIYVTDPGGGTPFPVSFPPDTTSTSCWPYPADQLSVVVSANKIDEFKRWAQAFGFRNIEESRPPQPSTGNRLLDVANVLLQVPPGSVLAAVPVVRAAPGVQFADVNQWFRIPEAPPPPYCPATPTPAAASG